MNTKACSLFFAIFSAVILFLGSCSWFDNLDGSDTDDSGLNGGITVTPSSITLARGDTQQFSADDSYVNWSLSGNTGSSSINSSGLLTIGADETASTLTVKAAKSYGDKSGTARVTVASAAQTPSGLKVVKPGLGSIQLSWNVLGGAGQYTVYRSTNGKDFAQIAAVSGTAYTDEAVSEGSYYYYRINANGVNSTVVFSTAAEYFNMPNFSQRKLVPLNGGSRHYYRFLVTSGSEYTIEWQNGNEGDLGYNDFYVSAWQNDGTEIFRNAYNGYSGPKNFTASSSGYVTVEVKNNKGDTVIGQYQAYCYGIDSIGDSGTVALPPYIVTTFKVSSSSSSSINLSWEGVSDAVKYHIYRSNTQTGTPGKIGESQSTAYTDNSVSAGGAYWYTIAAVNADGREGCRFQGAFGITASHYPLAAYSSAPILSLYGQSKHYYRLLVTKDVYYTIEWQDGSGGDLGYNDFYVSAWQNDGTAIFRDAYNGKTSPRNFKATSNGYVTIEVKNNRGTTSSDNYQIYYY